MDAPLEREISHVPGVSGLQRRTPTRRTSTVQNGAVKFQEGNGTNLNIHHKLRPVKMETNDVFGLIANISDLVPESEHTHSNPKSQNHFENKNANINDDEFRLMYNFKECIMPSEDDLDGEDDHSIKIQAQPVTFSKPADTQEKKKKTVKNINFHNLKESKLNNNLIPHEAQDNRIDVKRTTLKPCSVPTGLHHGGTVETLSPTTPPPHEKEGILGDNFDDTDVDESFIENEPLLPQHTYYCNKCDKFFESLNQFRHHRYSLCNGYRRKARHQCGICDKLFNSIEKKEAHQNSHTNARPFKCFDCDKCFNSKVARQMHHKNMHLKKKTRYLCCFCGYITPSPEHILAHEEEHRLPEGTEVPKPFKCLVCGKGFISRWKQRSHKKEHKIRKCAKCSEKFKTRKQFTYHMESVHTVHKTCKCKECDKQFKNTEALRSHRMIHSSVLVYFCDICDKGFKRKGNLKQHMITHSDERPITCPECGDSFKRITHLKQHTAAFHGDGRK